MSKVIRVGPVENGHSVIEHDRVLYLAGVAPTVSTGSTIEQATDVFAQIDALLARSGSSKKFLLQARIYVTDLAFKADINRAWHNWLDREDLPARATIGVSDLGPGVRLEVVVTAALPERFV